MKEPKGRIHQTTTTKTPNHQSLTESAVIRTDSVRRRLTEDQKLAALADTGLMQESQISRIRRLCRAQRRSVASFFKVSIPELLDCLEPDAQDELLADYLSNDNKESWKLLLELWPAANHTALLRVAVRRASQNTRPPQVSPTVGREQLVTVELTPSMRKLLEGYRISFNWRGAHIHDVLNFFLKMALLNVPIVQRTARKFINYRSAEKLEGSDQAKTLADDWLKKAAKAVVAAN